MAETFLCPSCGAPLDAPTGGETSIHCPFCNNTVVVPPELRTQPAVPATSVPAAASTAHPDDQDQSIYFSPLFWGCFTVFIILVVLAGIFVPLYQDRINAALHPSVPTPRLVQSGFTQKDTAIPRAPTLVPTLDLQATQDADMLQSTLQAGVQATGTAQAVASQAQASATQAAQATVNARQWAGVITAQKLWPVLLQDSFARQGNNWMVGDVRNEYYTGSRRIANGQYHWTATAKDSMGSFIFPDQKLSTLLLAGVDLQFLSGPPDADAGLCFRETQESNTFYYYALDNRGEYSLAIYLHDHWETFIDWTANSAIKVGEVNRLEVSAAGTHFILLVNGIPLADFSDDRLEQGNVGLGLTLANKGDQVDLTFANFEIRAPK